MKKKWEELGITSHFKKVHHFSSPKFKTKPSGMKGFINWCEKKEIETENLETIQRALKAASLFESNGDIDKAVEGAWKDHPVRMR